MIFSWLYNKYRSLMTNYDSEKKLRLVVDKMSLPGFPYWHDLGVVVDNSMVENFALICLREDNLKLITSKDGWKKMKEMLGEEEIDKICNHTACELIESVNGEEFKLTFNDAAVFRGWVLAHCCK